MWEYYLKPNYADAVILTDDGTPVADLTKIGDLEPDAGDRLEPGWTDREEAAD